MSDLRPDANPLMVALIAICVCAVLWIVTFLLEAHANTEPASESSGDSLAPIPDRDVFTPSRSAVRQPTTPPRSAARATSTPAPNRDHEPSPGGTPDAHVVAPSQGLGAGVRWPGYRSLSAEPAWVQAMAQCVRWRESNDIPTIVNAYGNAGLYQFADSTWESVTHLPAPASAYPRTVQDDAFATLYARGAGASHWAQTIGGCG